MNNIIISVWMFDEFKKLTEKAIEEAEDKTEEEYYRQVLKSIIFAERRQIGKREWKGEIND